MNVIRVNEILVLLHPVGDVFFVCLSICFRRVEVKLEKSPRTSGWIICISGLSVVTVTELLALSLFLFFPPIHVRCHNSCRICIFVSVEYPNAMNLRDLEQA